MSIREEVNRLKSNLSLLGNSRRGFAQSLIDQYEKKGRLSQMQQLWVDKLYVEATAPKPEKPEPVRVNLGSFEKLQELFILAKKNHIAVPRIKTVVNDKALEIAAANPGGKNPGCIYVKFDGQYYGKVLPSGTIELASQAILCEEVHNRLREIGENPTESGRVHGHKYNNCMFCGRDLRTTDSVYFGYGPICAEKWGLEWGTARERIVEDRIERNDQIMGDMINQTAKGFNFDD